MMKKLLSLITVIAVICSMCAFAAPTARTVTLSTSVEKANAGDEFVATLVLDTSNGVKTIGQKIAFDPNDIELGMSAEAKTATETIDASGYRDLVGTPDFPTLEDVYVALIGTKSYVDTTYYNTYKAYDTKNFGGATIDYEEKDGLGKIAFAYAASSAKNALNKVDNMVVGGAVLKVKTTEKKQTTISIVEASSSNGSNEKADSVVNTITLNLNGYGETAADPIVTYEGEANVVWGAKGEYAEGKATFSVKPVMGYTIAVTANGDEVAIDAAKGGEVTIDVTEDTTVVATATAITDGAYTYGETYKDGNTVYVFGKAPGAANFGFYVEKDGAALANKALEIYDGKFAATSGSANAFGMAFAFTGKGHTGAYTAAAYGDADTATTTAAFDIN